MRCDSPSRFNSISLSLLLTSSAISTGLSSPYQWNRAAKQTLRATKCLVFYGLPKTYFPVKFGTNSYSTENFRLRFQPQHFFVQLVSVCLCVNKNHKLYNIIEHIGFHAFVCQLLMHVKPNYGGWKITEFSLSLSMFIHIYRIHFSWIKCVSACAHTRFICAFFILFSWVMEMKKLPKIQQKIYIFIKKNEIECENQCVRCVKCQSSWMIHLRIGS